MKVVYEVIFLNEDSSFYKNSTMLAIKTIYFNLTTHTYPFHKHLFNTTLQGLYQVLTRGHVCYCTNYYANVSHL